MDMNTFLRMIQGDKDSSNVAAMLQSMGQTPAAVQPQPAIVNDPTSQMVSQIGQLLIDNPMSMDQIKATLGGAAAPVHDNRVGAAPVATDPYEQILRNIAMNALDSRTAAITDAAVNAMQQGAGSGKAQGDQSAAVDPRDVSKAGDTTGGAARVNARSHETGVTATTDSNGRVTLTNIGSDGKPTLQSTVAPGETPKAFGTSISSNIQDLLTQVRNSKDVASAQGMADALRSSIIEERLRIEKEARDFAEAEQRIPQMRRALTAQQSLDNTVPGMGMSPKSLAIQRNIQAAESIAAGRMKDWLGRNIPYQQLISTAKSAEEAINLAVQRKAAADQSANLKQQSAAIAAEKKAEEARIQYEGLSAAQKGLIIQLNPSLGAEGKEAEAIAFAKQQLKSSKDFEALMSASNDDEQNALAFSGNKLAIQLVAERESRLSGVDSSAIEKDLTDLNTLQLTPKELQEYAWASGVKDSAGVKQFMAQYNSLTGPGATKEQLAEGKLLTARIKKSMLQQNRTQKLLTNVMSWAPENSSLQLAAKKSMEINGDSSLQAALTLLTQDKPLTEQTAILTEIKKQLVEQARKYSNSPVAKVDVGQIIGQFDGMVARLGTLTLNDLAGAPLSNIVPFTKQVIGGFF